MSDTSLPPAPGDDAPIDAEFEPAHPKAETRQKSAAGPGWTAFAGISLTAVAALILAVFSAGWVPGFDPGAGQIKALETKLAALEQASTTQASQAATYSADLSDLSGRADSLRADRTRTVTELRALRDEIETLQVDISALQRARVAAIAERDDDASENLAAPDVSSLSARVASLEDALVTQLDTYNTAIESLKLRVVDLEDRAGSDTLTAATTSNQRTEAALALSAIEAAARRGRPFLTAHQRLETAMPGNQAIGRLTPLAAKAIPTLSDLRATFPALKTQALDREAETTSGSGGWMRNLFGDGIRVRQTAAVTARDHLDLAEAGLQAGELAETIEHIRAIDPNVQSVFTDWLQNAEDRHQLEETLEALRLTMIAEERP